MHDPQTYCESYYYNISFYLRSEVSGVAYSRCHLVRFMRQLVEITHPWWGTFIKNFQPQLNTLKQMKKLGVAATTKISKTLEIINWSEAFAGFLSRAVGVRTFPLPHVVNTMMHQAQCFNIWLQTHLIQKNIVQQKIIWQNVCRIITLYLRMITKVHYYLEESIRINQHAALTKPCQRKKNIRDYWLSLVRKYSVKDKWEKEIKKVDDFTLN